MKNPSCHLLLLLIVGSFAATMPSSAQVHYEDGRPWSQRVGSGPDAEVPGWYYNLGLTGIRAELVANEPKALLVKYVFQKSPANKLVKVDDLIIGVNGKKFTKEHRNGYGMEVFGAEGPIADLAEALENCQGRSGGGKLQLMLQRGKETIKADLKIDTDYGTYSATYPASCPKSDKILKELLTYITKQQGDNDSFGNPVHNTFASLALLGSGESKYLSDVRRNLRHICESLRATDEAARKDSLINWTYMGAAIVLSEYYLITKEKWLIKELEFIRDELEKGQYLDMSQINPKAKESHPDTYPKGPKQAHGGWGHNPGFEGYGPITMITAQGALSYALMQRCGIKIDQKRHDAAYDFLKRGTGDNGYLWYLDSVGGGADDWADMGRTGAAAIAFSLSPYSGSSYKAQALKYSNIIGKHPESFPDTHGSPPMGMGYEALGASVKPDNFRKLMDANRWWFTMAQCTDGTFYYQPNRDNAGYGPDARMSASAIVAFIFTIPKKNLVITGRESK